MRLRVPTHIPPAMTFAENGGVGEGRAENTTATGFNVDQFTFMFRGIIPNRGFSTLFAANHEVLNGTNSPLWIHVDTGNLGVSLRYYRSGNRGQWNWPNITYGEEYVLSAQYDRVSTSSVPRLWLRRVRVDKRLREVTPEQIQPPSGTANTPAAGYTVSDGDFGLGASGAPARVAFVQFWDRFLSEREQEQAYRRPFSVQSGLVLGLDGYGRDQSPRGQHATFAGAGAGITHGFNPFEGDEWDLEPRSIGFLAAAGGNLTAGAAMPVAGIGLLQGVGTLAAASASPFASASNLVATGDLAAGAAAPSAAAGALGATGALEASAAQPAASAADLQATAQLAAAAAPPAAAGAELLGLANLTAGAALPQAAASNLVGLASGSAAAASPAAAAANLEATAADSMAACAAMPVTGFGLLTGIGSLSASSAAPAATGGGLVGVGTLAASAAVPEAAASNLLGAGGLLAAAAVPMTNLGLLIGIATLSGSAAVSLAGAGLLLSDAPPEAPQKIIRGDSPFRYEFRGDSTFHPEFRGDSAFDQGT